MLLTKQRKRMLPKVIKKSWSTSVTRKSTEVWEFLSVRRSRRRELKRMELTDMTLKCRIKTE